MSGYYGCGRPWKLIEAVSEATLNVKLKHDQIIHVQHPTSVMHCILCGTIRVIVLLLKLSGLHGSVGMGPGHRVMIGRKKIIVFSHKHGSSSGEHTNLRLTSSHSRAGWRLKGCSLAHLHISRRIILLWFHPGNRASAETMWDFFLAA